MQDAAYFEKPQPSGALFCLWSIGLWMLPDIPLKDLRYTWPPAGWNNELESVFDCIARVSAGCEICKFKVAA